MDRSPPPMSRDRAALLLQTGGQFNSHGAIPVKPRITETNAELQCHLRKDSHGSHPVKDWTKPSTKDTKWNTVNRQPASVDPSAPGSFAKYAQQLQDLVSLGLTDLNAGRQCNNGTLKQSRPSPGMGLHKYQAKETQSLKGSGPVIVAMTGVQRLAKAV